MCLTSKLLYIYTLCIRRQRAILTLSRILLSFVQFTYFLLLIPLCCVLKLRLSLQIFLHIVSSVAWRDATRIRLIWGCDEWVLSMNKLCVEHSSVFYASLYKQTDGMLIINPLLLFFKYLYGLHLNMLFIYIYIQSIIYVMLWTLLFSLIKC